MLPYGIYEQIVNSRINKELAKMDPALYDIELESMGAEDARRILTIYISYVINQGLKVIRENYPSSQEDDALIAQIRLCNDIVKEIAAHAKEPDFEDNVILEKGEVLTSLTIPVQRPRSRSTSRRICWIICLTTLSMTLWHRAKLTASQNPLR